MLFGIILKEGGSSRMDTSLVVALAISFVFMILFLVWAWKLWQGQWLRSIAGNQLVSDDEYDSPHQRALGKRVAVCLVITTVFILTVLLKMIGDRGGSESLRTVLLVAQNLAIVAFVIDIVWVMVKTGRDQRRLIAAMTEEEYLQEDRKLDRKARIVIMVIVGGFLLFEFIAIAYFKN